MSGFKEYEKRWFNKEFNITHTNFNEDEFYQFQKLVRSNKKFIITRVGKGSKTKDGLFIESITIEEVDE